jgi:hypothetical protein
MASIVTWLVGLLFLGIGLWILLLRFEGLVDRIRPHTMAIGQMTVDGKDSRSHAELLRARFDHHFRRPAAIPKETGFLEVVALDAPDLFQQKALESPLERMTVDVSGVDVAKLAHFVNQLARPDQWVVEGDFQTRTDRALLSLRLRRGERLIRTWYLERARPSSGDNSALLEQLIDDAIFQLVYDFGNDADEDPDLRKWRRIVPPPTGFPSRTAVAAYYEGRGALSRYFAQGAWADLDVAIDRLQMLRAQMPEYSDGLQLLGMALAERRSETEAIHVYEQLRAVLLPREEDWDALAPEARRRVLSVDLLKATATLKLSTWQSAHAAIRQLMQLHERLDAGLASTQSDAERAALTELKAQTAVQLAQAYGLYLFYVQHHTVADMFGSAEAPDALRIADAADLGVLRTGAPADAKPIVRRVMRTAAAQSDLWLEAARKEHTALEPLWGELADGERRKTELTSRLHVAAGYTRYRMAELERHDANASETVFGETFDARLKQAIAALRTADAAHPNHYVVLQLLGQVYSEPRQPGEQLTIAEQYFERATQSNPSDYSGHELLAGVLLRRLANVGVDLANRSMIDKGLGEAQRAVTLRELSGVAHRLRAQFQTLLLEIERDPGRRRELRATLEQYLQQADRFLPRPFGRPDVDLSWLRVVDATRRLGDDPAAFAQSRQRVLTMIDELIADCTRLEERWVAEQRVFHVQGLHRRARALADDVRRATENNWREIPIPLL